MSLDNMLWIASKHLVGPFAGQDDLDVFRRLHRQQVDRQIGGFRDRGTPVAAEHRQQGGKVVCGEFERRMNSSNLAGSFGGGGQLGSRIIREANRKRS